MTYPIEVDSQLTKATWKTVNSSFAFTCMPGLGALPWDLTAILPEKAESSAPHKKKAAASSARLQPSKWTPDVLKSMGDKKLKV